MSLFSSFLLRRFILTKTRVSYAKKNLSCILYNIYAQENNYFFGLESKEFLQVIKIVSWTFIQDFFDICAIIFEIKILSGEKY